MILPDDDSTPLGERPLQSPREIGEAIDAELAFHLEARTATLTRQGLDELSARAQAEAEFGDLAHTRTYCAKQDVAAERSRRRAAWFADAGIDMRRALRSMVKHPRHAVVAIVTLALGVAAASTMTSVMRQLVFTPFPFPGGERIVWIWQHPDATSDMDLLPANSVVEQWRARSHDFETFEAVRPSGHQVLDDGRDPAVVSTAQMSDSLLTFLHMQTQQGRGITRDDRLPEAPAVAIVSHAFWQGHFGGARDVVGRHLRLGDRDYTVIGIAPPALRGVPGLAIAVDVWTPLAAHEASRYSAILLARLRSGVAPTAAVAELTTILQSAAGRSGAHQTGTVSLRSAREMVGTTRIRAMTVLWAASALLLAIAAFNYLNLLLARALERKQEFAIRSALGAPFGRILRQMCVEATLIAAAAYLVQIPASLLILRIAAKLRPATLWMLDTVGLDARVLMAGVPVVALIALGGAALAIASGTRLDFMALRAGVSTPSRRSYHVRRTLIAIEVGIAFTVLVGAALLARSFTQLLRQNPGFRPDGVLVVGLVAPDRLADDTADTSTRWNALEYAIGADAAVVGVKRGLSMPPSSGFEFGKVELPDRPSPADTNEQTFAASYVESGFFSLAGIPLVAGRDFDASIAADDHPVIINAAMARRYWGDGNAVGQRIRISTQQRGWMRVIGVASNVIAQGLHSETGLPQMYHPMSEFHGTPELLIRIRGQRGAAVTAVRKRIRETEPGLTIGRVVFATDDLHDSARADEFYVVMLGMMAIFAGALAVSGVFGLVTSIATQRTREMAVRMALGSSRGRVYRLVLRDGMQPTVAGIAIGLGGAYFLGRTLQSVLFGVGGTDPVTYAGAAVLLLSAAALACVAPARHVAQVDPVVVLRGE